MVCWSWERGDIGAEDIYASERFWTLRLPLSTDRGTWGEIKLYRGLDADALLLDINYLCHLFQRETARAAERICGGAVAQPQPEAAPPAFARAAREAR
jgi:hypothetical protein